MGQTGQDLKIKVLVMGCVKIGIDQSLVNLTRYK